MENNAYLNPGDSPNGLVGVRRLNHIPLYVIGTIAAVVALVIAMVAIDKSKQAAAQPQDHGGSTDSYAAQAVGDHVGGYLPAFHSPTSPTPWPRPTPPLVTSTPMPTPDDSEMKMRRAAFFQALGAGTAVEGEATSAPTSLKNSQKR